MSIIDGTLLIVFGALAVAAGVATLVAAVLDQDWPYRTRGRGGWVDLERWFGRAAARAVMVPVSLAFLALGLFFMLKGVGLL